MSAHVNPTYRAQIVSQEHYQWHDQDYKLDQFMKQFKIHLPMIIKVTEGYMGIDDYHTFAADELFRVHKYACQRRVLLRNTDNGTVISVPVEYERKLHIVHKNGKKEKAEYMKDIIDKMSFPDETKRLLFEDSEDPGSVGFLVGLDTMEYTNFGELQIMDSYTENYLVANAILNGGVLSRINLAIPAYMSIKVIYATGLIPEKGGHQEWTEFVQRLNQIAEKTNYSDVSTNNELMLYGADILEQEDDYEMIEPINYAYRRLAQPETETQQNLQQELKLNLQRSPSADNVYSEVTPTAPVRPVANVSATQPQGPKVLPKPKNLPPPVAVKRNKQPLSTSAVQPPRPSLSPTSPPSSSPSHTGRQKPNVKQPPHVLSNTTTSIGSGFPSFSEVPVDISTLSVREVTSCLQLLKLNSYVEPFMENDIDGEMLHDLTEEMLRDTFQMSTFHAKKLRKFVDGYRPNVG